VNRICVFCGSAEGNDPAILDEARTLGRLLAENGIGLVYGGAGIGVMGVLANACLDAGGDVTGIIPRTLMRKEVAHRELTKLIVVEDMHQRKALMADLSDAFIALPGGFGTFEEIFEMVTWRQIRIHTKPLVLVNTNGFYDGLNAFVTHATNTGFIRETNLERLPLAEDSLKALTLLHLKFRVKTI
jgi:uncharacterized protein (TIGR00730 family)